MFRFSVLPCALLLIAGLVSLVGCNKTRTPDEGSTAPSGPTAAQTPDEARTPVKAEATQAAPTGENTAAWNASKLYWNQFVNQSLQKLEATQRLREADPFAQSTLLRSPDGKHWALLIHREEATVASRWLLLIQSAETGKLEQTYDFIRAHAVEKIVWSADSQQILLLERSYDQREAAGRLWVIKPSQRSAFMAEDWITNFSLAPNGRDLLLEKAASATKPFWPRNLAVLRLDRLGRDVARPLLKLAYPATQLGKFGPWIPAGDDKTNFTMKLTLHDYPEGSFEAKVRELVYSTKTGDFEKTP